MPFQCDGCESTFREKKNLQQHRRKEHGLKKYKCDHCNYHSDDRSTLYIYTIYINNKTFTLQFKHNLYTTFHYHTHYYTLHTNIKTNTLHYKLTLDKYTIHLTNIH